jgi:hypothetical protein
MRRPKTIRYPHLATALALDSRHRYVIGALASIAPNRLGMIVSGRVEPRPAEMERLAMVLGSTVEYLFCNG